MPDDPGLYDFDQQSAELARKRKMMELLQQESLQPMQLAAPHARASWLNALVPIVQSLAANKQSKDLDAQDRALASSRQAGMDKWMGSMPQGTPGTEGSAMPPPELGGGPAQPAMLPKEPTAPDLMKWGMGGMQFGPAGQKIAEHAISQGMTSMIPKDPYKVVGGGIYDTRTGKFAMSDEAKAELESKQQERQDRIDQRRDAAIERAQTAADRLAAEERWRKDSNDLRRDLHAASGAGAGHVIQQGYSNTGERVVVSKDGGQYTVGRDEKGNVVHKPYEGAVTPNVTVEREVGKLQSLTASMADSDRLLKVVDENKEAFGPKSRVSGVPIIGPAMGAKAFTSEQLAAQTKMATSVAQTLHALYGSALSQGEQDRAKQFLPTKDDTYATLIPKLRSMREWAEQQKTQYSSASKAIAGKRQETGGLREKYGLGNE